jgi:DNA-binding CsgD family transcriptional regulator
MLGEQSSHHADADGMEHVALGWLSLDVRPRIIVSTTLHVRWSNHLALECLDARSLVHVRGDELVCKNNAIHKAVSDFVRALDDKVQTLAVSDEGRRDVLLLRGWGLVHEGERLACLELGRDREGFVCDYRDLRAVFGLTQAEHRVVLQMLGGNTVTIIAETLHLSVGTVRTHVKHLYSKVGVTSREELLGRLAPYRLV